MRIKFLAALILAFIWGVSGCTTASVSPGQSEAKIDLPTIIAKQTEAMKSVNSCRTSIYLEVDLHSGTTDVGDTSLTANMKSNIDTGQHLLSSVITTQIVISSSKKNLEEDIIASGNSLYFKDSSQSGWQVKSLDGPSADKLWSEQSDQVTGSKYSALISEENLTYSGTENSNGHSCLVFKGPLNNGALGEITPELQQQIQTLPRLSQDQLANLFSNTEVTFLIDEQSYNLREFRLESQIDQQIQGQRVYGTVKQYCRFDAFNEPVSVKVPLVQ
jgi:hypothetical protein